MFNKLILSLLSLFMMLAFRAEATRFSSNYSCQDAAKTCVSRGMREVEGFQVYKDCWEWTYRKTCNYPSKNDCSKYGHCYEVANRDCLLKDSLGNCVNLLKEFSCKRWVPAIIENKKVRVALEEKEGADSIICKGIPCIDGNCVDKSYMTNGEMIDSVSKLYAVSEAKGADNMDFQIFKGDSNHCTKKATSYTNCCSTSLSGWGTNLGAGCSKDEKTLIESRKNNLCAYVGKENKQMVGFNVLVKHYWCCFDSVLSKVIQVEGRKQIGLNFGSGGNPNCRGLTLEELTQLDFEKMDLGEFIEDFKLKFFGKFKAPNIADMTARVNSALPNIRKYNNNPNNKANNSTGWSTKVGDDSWEAEEERRLVIESEERKRTEAARKVEEQRQTQEALIKRKKAKQQEIEKLRVISHANRDKLDATVTQFAQATPGYWPSGALIDGYEMMIRSAYPNPKVFYNSQQLEARCGHISAYKALKEARDQHLISWKKWVDSNKELDSGNY